MKKKLPMHLVWPSPTYLPSYIDALKRGWSPDISGGEAAAQKELEKITIDPKEYIASLIDREAKGKVITLPDGSKVARLPSYQRWLWDGEFCGYIAFRWQPGTEQLPSYCLGHIGYSVVPWKQGKGYATKALCDILSDVKAEGLAYVEITTDPINIASQHVILSNGGILFENFIKIPQHGGTEGLRFRIYF